MTDFYCYLPVIIFQLLSCRLLCLVQNLFSSSCLFFNSATPWAETGATSMSECFFGKSCRRLLGRFESNEKGGNIYLCHGADLCQCALPLMNPPLTFKSQLKGRPPTAAHLMLPPTVFSVRTDGEAKEKDAVWFLLFFFLFLSFMGENTGCSPLPRLQATTKFVPCFCCWFCPL